MQRWINLTVRLRQLFVPGSRTELLVVVVTLAFLASVTAGHGECVVRQATAVPVETTRGAITVPMEINGRAAAFVLDSGAQRSVVSQQAVDRLGLSRDQWVGTTMGGIGGIESRPNANPRSISLGGVALVRRTLNHDNSLTVGVLPSVRTGERPIDGLLGRDFLSLFDLDLDASGGRLTVYSVRGCSGRFLPWTGSYAAIPVSTPAAEAIVVPVRLDGRPLRALLDSGASASLLAAPGIFKMGIDPASLAADQADRISGLGPRAITVHRHRFRALDVGGGVVDSPMIWVEPIRLTPVVDMLLGADWLAARRVWISFATHQLFVAGAP
jgi:hypothetical protein